MRGLYILLIILLSTTTIFAHDDLEERIAAKTLEIKDSPSEAVLYLDRGILYYQHEEYSKALVDYHKADSLEYKDKILFLRMAETYLAMQNYEKGIRVSDRYLAIDSVDIKIHKLRGESFFGLKKYDEAIDAFSYVIQYTTDLRPENYLQLSTTYIQKDSTLIDSALIVIDKGLSQLGENVFILKREKMNYLKIKKEYSAVLDLYNELIEASERKEYIYWQKAEYLHEIGKYRLSQAALEQAKKTYGKLHPMLKRTKAIKQLLINIEILENQNKTYAKK